jgi:signal transduction histidine kinase
VVFEIVLKGKNMYPHKLKLQISVTLFGILILAMLLINIIIIVFWYQHLVQQKIMLVRNTVGVWQNAWLLPDYGAGWSEAKSSLQILHRSLGPECQQVLILQDTHVMKAVDTFDQWGLEALVLSTSTSGKEVIRYIEKTDIPFFYTPKSLVISLPSNGSQPAGRSVGVVLDISNMLPELWAKEKVIAVYLFLNALILTIVGFFRIRRLVLGPIETLVGVAENYQVSESGGFFSDHSENEFGQLSRAMNNMVKRIEEDRRKLCKTVDSLAETNLQLKNAQHEIIRAERLSVAGRLSAALAHEIGNPVTIVQGYVELLEDSQLAEKERSEFSSRALNELARIDKLIRQFLDVTHIKQSKNEVLDPADILLDVSRALETSFKKKNINTFITVPDKVVCVWGDKEMLRQVYLNCLINALDAIAEKHCGAPGGEISAVITVVGNEVSNQIVIAFQDNGSGISEENLEYIFEPFFTTKDPGKGTGLGLAICYRIIHSMSGKIEVKSVPLNGTLFRVTLPEYNKDSERKSAK